MKTNLTRYYRITLFLFGLMLLLSVYNVPSVFGQDTVVEWPEELTKLQQIALQNHPIAKAIEYENSAAKKEIGQAEFMDSAELYYFYDEANIARNDVPIRVWGITQRFRFPTVYIRDKKRLSERHEMQQWKGKQETIQLQRDLAEAWLAVVYEKHRLSLYKEVESYFAQFLKAEKAQFESGAKPKIGVLRAQAELAKMSVEKASISSRIQSAMYRLNQLAASEEFKELETERLPRFPFTEVAIEGVPSRQVAEAEVSLAKAITSLAKAEWMPDLSVQLFQGTNSAIGAEMYQGFQFGITIPLWLKPKLSKVSAASTKAKASMERLDWVNKQLQTKLLEQKTELKRLETMLNAFEKDVMKLNQEAFLMAKKSYEGGNSSYMEFLQSLEAIRQSELNYLDILMEYNQTVLAIRYMDM